MVGLENNNGDAISCIILLLDNLAVSNDAEVVVVTMHQDECALHKHMEDKDLSNDVLSKLDPISPEALQHLYHCNCDTGIEATFSSENGNSLLVPIVLSDVKKKHSWLRDEEATKEMLDGAIELGSDSPLIKDMLPEFNKRMGYRVVAPPGDMNVH